VHVCTKWHLNQLPLVHTKVWHKFAIGSQRQHEELLTLPACGDCSGTLAGAAMQCTLLFISVTVTLQPKTSWRRIGFLVVEENSHLLIPQIPKLKFLTHFIMFEVSYSYIAKCLLMLFYNICQPRDDFFFCINCLILEYFCRTTFWYANTNYVGPL
jgi:CBS domain containing-hemolysin-like protein